MKDLKVSFVIPCYKSVNTIDIVINEIIREIDKLGYGYEIICVDDCSPDDVFLKIKELAKHNTCIKGLHFGRNFGQHAGMIAGAKYSSGDYVVFLDDDGQCPVDHLEELLQPLYEGWDVSIAAYGKKKQSLYKNLGSKINEIAAKYFMGKPCNIQIGNFMAVKKCIVKEISKYNGPYPYIAGLLFRSSSRIINVPMSDRYRLDGGTTYTFRKLFALWLNGFTAFSIKPLRLISLLGVGSSILGVLYAGFIIMHRITNQDLVMGWSSLMAVILIIGGVIMLSLGILGEYVGRIYMSLNATPQYIIYDSVNIDE